MEEFSKSYLENPWRTFVLPQSRTQIDQLQIPSQILLSHFPPSDPLCEWWCYQSFLTAESALGSTAWPVRPSNTSRNLRALRATLEARSKMSQRKSRRSLWRFNYSSTPLWLALYCDSLLLQIPEFTFWTTHRSLSSQVSNVFLALPDLSLKMLLVPATEPFVGSRGPNPGLEV